MIKHQIVPFEGRSMIFPTSKEAIAFAKPIAEKLEKGNKGKMGNRINHTVFPGYVALANGKSRPAIIWQYETID